MTTAIRTRPARSGRYRPLHAATCHYRPLQAAACTYRIAFGPRAGHQVLTVQGIMPREKDFKQPLCADMQGLSLHAAVRG